MLLLRHWKKENNGILISIIGLILLLLNNGLQADEITQVDLDRYYGKVPPRVYQILQHFRTTEELWKFINDRRKVRELIKPDYRKDKVMHSLWWGEKYNLNIYADILEKRNGNK